MTLAPKDTNSHHFTLSWKKGKNEIKGLWPICGLKLMSSTAKEKLSRSAFFAHIKEYITF